MSKQTNSDRRQFMIRTGGVSAVAALAVTLGERLQAQDEASGGVSINHSVCKWCYRDVSMDDLCTAGKEFGLQSVELLQPDDIKIVQKHGLTCALVGNVTTETAEGVKVGGITKAWNRTEHHKALLEGYEKQIVAAKDLGLDNVICFSGNRDGMDDELGMKNCAEGLKKLMPIAEKHGVTITMELLNSKVNHKDYMCDHTEWGVGLCEMIGSERFKLLYDIYHMQIMEGDVIATIEKHHKHFSHYHTGGVPGRNEIDDTQELYYPAIMKAIQKTGFKGYVAQEFIPKRDDKLGSLKQGVEICTV
jgi:hydroxypyruvate isomerase